MKVQNFDQMLTLHALMKESYASVTFSGLVIFLSVRHPLIIRKKKIPPRNDD